MSGAQTGGDGGSAQTDGGGSGGAPAVDAGSDGMPAPGGMAGGLPEVSSDGDGDRTIGPTYAPDPLTQLGAGVPAGKDFTFMMPLAQSKYYTGAGQKNALANRAISVHVPMQYNPAHPAALMVTQDAQGGNYLPAVIDNLVAKNEIPVIVLIRVANGGGDSVGNERGLEYDTVSGLYAEFIIKEVVPQTITVAKTQLNIDLKITDDPNGHLTMGGSSGGACAFSMVWWHPDLFRRMIGWSPTLVNQVPVGSPFPHGCWIYHDIDPYSMTAPNGLVVASCEPATGFTGDSNPGPCDTPLSQATCEAVKGCVWNTNRNRPIRIWHESATGDLGAGGGPATYRNFDLANQRTAAALKLRGYHYHYDHALGAGHNDGKVQAQTIVEAMRWVWRGYTLPQ
jgi:enterochelin esterase-like enzyme